MYKNPLILKDLNETVLQVKDLYAEGLDLINEITQELLCYNAFSEVRIHVTLLIMCTGWMCAVHLAFKRLKLY